jgi:hypothetical protein
MRLRRNGGSVFASEPRHYADNSRSMKLAFLFLCGLLAIASPALAQTDSTPRGRPVREAIDSLEAGRQRWARARVLEYVLQSHADCFCVYSRDAFVKQRPLLIIRDRSIIGRAKGKEGPSPSPEFTIPDLFEQVEEDASSDGRIIDQLELNPVYGFPTRYKAHDPQIPDDWLQLQVDSFAVIRHR